MKVFISYRRDDAAEVAGSIRLMLEKEFGNGSVFLDVASVRPGQDFREPVNQSLTACDAVLVIMGKNWVGTRADGSRRIDDKNDLVRYEVTTALRRNVDVMPILLHGAEMPRAPELPVPLRKLVFRQAEQVGRDTLGRDMEKLIGYLRAIDPDARPIENQAVAVTVGDEIRWLQPEQSAGSLVAYARDRSETPPTGSSIALSIDGAVCAQVSGSVLTIYGLVDVRSGSYERWRNVNLDASWQHPKVIAIGKLGTQAVNVALTYEKLPHNLRKVARFGLHHSGEIDRLRECDADAVSAAFVGSILLYVDQREGRINEWEGNKEVPQPWRKDPGVGVRWIDSAIVDGDSLVAVLALDDVSGSHGASVVCFLGNDDAPQTRKAVATRSKQMVITRSLDRGGAQRIAVKSDDWVDFAIH